MNYYKNKTINQDIFFFFTHLFLQTEKKGKKTD